MLLVADLVVTRTRLSKLGPVLRLKDVEVQTDMVDKVMHLDYGAQTTVVVVTDQMTETMVEMKAEISAAGRAASTRRWPDVVTTAYGRCYHLEDCEHAVNPRRSRWKPCSVCLCESGCIRMASPLTSGTTGAGMSSGWSTME